MLLPLFLLGLLLFVFWIIILVDAITRKFKSESDKIVWVIVVILLGIIGAFVYYFVVYYKDKTKSLKWFWWTLLGVGILAIVLVILMVILFSVVVYNPAI